MPRTQKKEFLQTSLDSCRSTIIQQETEIKRLKESLGICNKRILQLETQVSFSAEQLSSRNPPDQSTACCNNPRNDRNSSLTEKLDKLVETLQTAHPNSKSITNIYNTSSNTRSYSNQSISTQTDSFLCDKRNGKSCNLKNHTTDHCPPTCQREACEFQTNSADALKKHMETDHITKTSFHCESCDILFVSETEKEEHMRSQHKQTTSEQCNFCDKVFQSPFHLLEHTEDVHSSEFLVCQLCKHRCKTSVLLKHHMETNHGLSSNILPECSLQTTVHTLHNQTSRTNSCHETEPATSTSAQGRPSRGNTL